MNRDGKHKNSAEIIKRLIKRLPEMIVIALLIFAGISLFMETSNAQHATAFVYHFVYDSAYDLNYIPLAHKLFYSIPAVVLVYLFAEDIIKVSIKNESPNDESIQTT